MKSISLSHRMFRLQLAIVGTCLLITWVLVTTNDYQIFQDLTQKKYESNAEILSRNLTTCLSFHDNDECRRVLGTLKQDTTILSAQVTDAKGKVVAHYGSRLSAISRNDSSGRVEISDSKIHLKFPVSESGERLGTLEITAVFDLTQTFGFRHLLLFLVTILLTSLVGIHLSKILQEKVSEQLKLLLRAMQDIRRTRNYHLRLRDEENWKRVDVREFQELGDSFDSMIAEVDRRDYSLKKHTEDLEKVIEVKVQEVIRSAELASLGEMAGGIAHEINNPLTIIKSTSKVLRKQLDRERFDADAFREALGDIDATVDRIAKIVVGLRNISRKAQNDDIAPGNWGEVFADVIEVAETKFKSKGIEIRKLFESQDACSTFSGNRIQLAQVLVNLLNNSFDALIDLPEDSKWIEIRVARTSDSVVLRLTDGGPGIPAKVREKMFHPFFTTKEIGKGTGIGLAISKSMVEKMGGELAYDESAPRTTFEIRLKAAA